MQADTPHHRATARRHLRYLVAPKHHGGSAAASCWLTSITFDEEFAIFDRADGILVALPGGDNEQVADSAGNLYGYEILGTTDQHLRELGTWGQQMAEYPVKDNSRIDPRRGSGSAAAPGALRRPLWMISIGIGKPRMGSSESLFSPEFSDVLEGRRCRGSSPVWLA